MASEYLWTQIEPATAIICACVVTYRPLFTNLNLNLSKFSGFFSRSRSELSSPTSNDEKDSQLQWPVATNLLGRDVTLINGRVAKNDLHVVNMALQRPDLRQYYNKTIVKVPDYRPRSAQETNGTYMPGYEMPPFYVAEDNKVVVNPFA